jgi:hypothetical protein
VWVCIVCMRCMLESVCVWVCILYVLYLLYLSIYVSMYLSMCMYVKEGCLGMYCMYCPYVCVCKMKCSLFIHVTIFLFLVLFFSFSFLFLFFFFSFSFSCLFCVGLDRAASLSVLTGVYFLLSLLWFLMLPHSILELEVVGQACVPSYVRRFDLPVGKAYQMYDAIVVGCMG